MNEIVRWGIIGCGDVVQRKSGPAFQSAARSRLSAVMRRSTDMAEEFARKHDVPFWTGNAEELIERPDVDAVYIASPPLTHLKYALRVCASGKPCLIEKPMGRSSVECREMTRAFSERGVPLFVSYYRRYLPKFLKVKEILESGQLGPVVSVNYRCYGPGKTKPWKLNPRVSGGGIFFDIGGHVLDLLEFWFGPLELAGGDASNFSLTHETEDVVALTFRAPGGAVGTATWNFLAPENGDLLEIEGLSGKLCLSCANYESPLAMERYVRDDNGPLFSANNLKNNARRLIGKKKKKNPIRVVKSRLEFSPIPYQHEPLIQSVVDCILDGKPCEATGDTALRISEVMDSVLSDYYCGRQDEFWKRPHTWRGANLVEAAGERQQDYRFTQEQMQFYEKNGYLGPFKCDAPALQRLVLPKHGKVDFHLDDPTALELFCHPSIVDRVKQVLHADWALLFKSRFWIKQPRSTTEAPWHQDVGAANGGYLPDGSPVPSVTVWLAVDNSDKENGGVKVLPGTHTQLFGDWRDSINAGIAESGALDDFDLANAPLLEAKAGEFFIFHSWLLHGSGPNNSDRRRAGINIRFVAPDNDVDSRYHYVRAG